MIKTISITSITIAAMVIAFMLFAGTALAGQNLIGFGFSSSPAGTVGPGISGDIYGNTSNPSGNGNGVLPSLSPGPWVCAGVDCSAQPTEAGGSMGTFITGPLGLDVANPTFANGKSPGPDFSDN